jgi:predicted ABC-type exoprotein transport system permease subunit
MRNRFLLALLSIALVAAFGVLNWSAITAPTVISLGFISFDAPLGMVLLSLTVLLLLVFLGYMAVWQGQILMETRRQQKELQQQRALADQAEASRFTELKVSMLAEFEKMAAQLQQTQATASREMREHANSLAAMLGEMDDRAKSPPGAQV